jgi:hypothetical protein
MEVPIQTGPCLVKAPHRELLLQNRAKSSSPVTGTPCLNKVLFKQGPLTGIPYTHRLYLSRTLSREVPI